MRKQQTEPVFDRTPPQSIDAERSVLGACLLNPDAIGAALEILGDTPEDAFYVEAHRHVYSAIIDLFKRNTPIDPVTLMEEIAKQGLLDQIGGGKYIAELSGAVPTSANVEYYAGIVSDAAQRRKLISTCTRIVGFAYGAADESDSILSTKELCERAESEIFRITEYSQKAKIYNLNDIVEEQCRVIENSVVNRVFVGMKTRFKDYDFLMCGLKPAEMTVMAARPSVGKTALALNLAATIAEENQVIFISLEMAKEQLAQRMIFNAGDITSWQVSQHMYSQSIIREKLRRAETSLSKLRLRVIDTSEITPTQIMSLCRRQKSKQGLDFLVIDYLQLISPNNRRLPREQQVSECAWVMKQISKECNCHVLLLCQFNREADKDGGRPKLSHLRESGAIEQHCDNALLLSRNEDSTLNCHLAKHRNGVTGEFKLHFNKNTQTFQNAASDGQPEPDSQYPPRASWRDHTEPKPRQEEELFAPAEYDDGDKDEYPY